MRARRFLALGLLAIAGSAMAQHRAIPIVKSHTLAPGRQLKLVPTGELILRLATPSSLSDVLRNHGLSLVRVFGDDPTRVVVRPGLAGTAEILARTVLEDGNVLSASLNYLRPDHLRTWTPNDPLYAPNSSAGTSGQWHLSNATTPGLDVNVVPAWAKDWTGFGVKIGIVDEGVEYTHPDLAANYDSADSYDFLDNDADPMPVAGEVHATSVAGVAAARGGNGIGVTGAAPLANFASLRLGYDTASEQNAILYHSSGSNTSITIKNHSYGDISPYLDRTAEASSIVTSSAAGTIHVWAAGNERGTWSQDTNTYWRERAPETVAVAALGSDGKFAWYSNFGSCIFVTAPSSSDSGPFPGITTTDRTGSDGYNGLTDLNYTNQFGGTSSASPLVAGVLALAKQAQPNLNVRWAKQLLARTAKKVDASDATAEGDTWRTNAAGLSFNQNYGFGLIDAGALLTELAKTSGVSALTTETASDSTAVSIPDANATGVTKSFTINASTPVEEVQVGVNITHTFRGDLEAYVISPSGTKSRLWKAAPTDSQNQDPGQNIVWTYTTNAFWGENPHGTWKLQVIDTVAQDTGTLNSCSITPLMGTLVYKNRIDGTVTLQDFTGSTASVPLTVEVRNPGSTTALATYTVTPDATGHFSFYIAPTGGTYDVAVKASHWLRRTLKNVTFAGNVATIAPSLINGDVNGDNQITSTDNSILSTAYRSKSTSSNWDPRADLNGDGQVSATDASILSRNFRTKGDN